MVNPLRRINALIKTISGFDQRVCAIQEALGGIEASKNSQKEGGINKQEFQVYSQWGEWA